MARQYSVQTVLAIFKDLRVKRSLYYLVFGESLLNDAVVLVIHRILLDMLDAEKQSFSVWVLLLGIAKFCIVSGGSLLIGLLFGVLSSLLTLATRHVEDSEPILLLVLAYSAYVSAEIFEWSGVVSIICCGLLHI
ncbi:hypothetical protein TYRP_004816 [Tyrophagus putrescentiae]|nr:hypothetical protein TYRP_004816 [Tyrophagus putrescentiae]